MTGTIRRYRKVLKRNRKGTDEQILRMNSIGMTLPAIGQKLSCHPTTVHLRLKTLGVPTADTRRAFMEEVLSTLPPGFTEHLADVLMAGEQPRSIKDYVRELLVKDVNSRIPTLPTVEEEALDA